MTEWTLFIAPEVERAQEGRIRAVAQEVAARMAELGIAVRIEEVSADDTVRRLGAPGPVPLAFVPSDWERRIGSGFPSMNEEEREVVRKAGAVFDRLGGRQVAAGPDAELARLRARWLRNQ